MHLNIEFKDNAYNLNYRIQMMTENSLSGNSSMLKASEAVFKNKNVSKLSFYETNMENYSKNQKFNL
jgi:hypothetical protein